MKRRKKMQNKQTTAPLRGLDIGTSRIVVAESNGSDCRYRAERNAFLALPASRLTQAMLDKESVSYKVGDADILVLGEKAEQFANIFCRDTRRPMQNGLLNPAERRGLEVIEETVRRLCGDSKDGGRVCFSVPSPAPGAEAELTFHENTLAEMLQRLGFQPSSVSEGLAVVFAELAEAHFTGIGISFGGGMCNVCLAYLGMPVIAFGTAKAGDFIDRNAAAVTGEKPPAVRLIKEQAFVLNGHCGTHLEQALSIYYDDMIQTVVSRLRDRLADSREVPKLDRPVPVVVSGGSARVGGFVPRLEKALRETDLGLRIGEIRLAADPLNSTARGALIAAQSEN